MQFNLGGTVPSRPVKPTYSSQAHPRCSSGLTGALLLLLAFALQGRLSQMSLGEDVDAEVEALRYTYGEELSIGIEGDTCTLQITVQPHTGGDSSVQFVEARLQLLVDSSYPTCGPSISVMDAKGMDDARVRALWQHLQQEAELACGELVLGHLIELAKDHLTASNVPDGACMICLDDMVADAAASTSGSDAEGAAALAKLPCFHAFHT